MAKGLHELESQVLLDSSKTLTQKHFTNNLKSLKKMVGELGEEKEVSSARSLRDIAIKITQPGRAEPDDEVEGEAVPQVRVMEVHTPPSSLGEVSGERRESGAEEGQEEGYRGLRESVVVEELVDEEDEP